MINEAIGKILGMAMAYGVSALGLFLAYVNYRRRIVKAEKVMTPTAWGVLVAILLVVAGGVLVVSQLAEAPASPAAEAVATVVQEAAPQTEAAVAAAAAVDHSRWPLVGMVLPVTIFLFATWVTAALYTHFSRTGH